MSTNTKKMNMALMLQKENLNSIVNQYRCPEGEEGIAVDEFFNGINNNVINQSIEALQIEDKNRVLELGHGSCNHLPFLMKQAAHVKYFGMEISEVMVNEATRINGKFIRRRDALFQLYDGLKVPYVHNIFDRVLTINTIYFWENPAEYLNEMFRVLKPGGKFVITFTNSTFLEQLAAVSNNGIFTLYNKEKIKELIVDTDFLLDSIEEKVERIKDDSGNWIDSNYTVVVLSKKPKNRYLDLQ